MVLTQRRYTFDELLSMPDDGHFYELLDGELYAVTSPNLDHSDVVRMLWRWLDRADQAGYGSAYTAPTGVVLDPSIARENAPEPDAFFVGTERSGILAGTYVQGVPSFVIEVLSDSTRLRDLPGGKKWQTYEQFAVPTYWIVDPETRTIARYTWSNGHYAEPAVLHASGVLSSPLFPGITLTVEALFAPVRQPAQPVPRPSPFRLRPRPSNG